MNTNENTTGMKERKVILSTLWIFVLANYMYCDVMSLMNPDDLKQIMTGTIGSIHLNQQFLLGAAIIMEIPILMILLSRILNYKINRWANIIAGEIMTVVQIASLFAGTALTLHYIFYSTVEIACTVFIAWYAWKWRKPVENAVA